VTIIKIILFYWTINTQYNTVVCVYDIVKNQNNNLHIMRQKPDTNLFITSCESQYVGIAIHNRWNHGPVKYICKSL